MLSSEEELYYSAEEEDIKDVKQNMESENVKEFDDFTFKLTETRHHNKKYTTTEYYIDFDKPNNKLYRLYITKNIRRILHTFINGFGKNTITSGIMCYPVRSSVQGRYPSMKTKDEIVYWFIYRNHLMENGEKRTTLYRLTKKLTIEEIPLNLFRTDAYIRVINVIRLHQLIGLNFCDIKDVKRYIEAVKTKTKRLTNIDIDHIDGNKYNNKPSNLNITTHHENVIKTSNRNVKPCIYFTGDVKTLRPLRKINNVPLAYDYYIDNDSNIYKQFKNGYKQMLLYKDNIGQHYYKLSKDNNTKSPIFIYKHVLITLHSKQNVLT